MKQKLTLMFLFSLLAHITVAGVLIYLPYQLSKNDSIGHPNEIIWAFMQNQVVHRPLFRGSRTSTLSRGINSHQDREKDGGDNSMQNNVKGEVSGQESGVRDQKIETRGQESVDKRDEFSGQSFQQENQNHDIFYSIQETVQFGVNLDCNDPSRCGGGNRSGGQSSINSRGNGNGDEGSGGDRLTGSLEYLRREIERHKYYPTLARMNGIEGTVTINFHIGKDGKPESIIIGKSSGSKILDESAIHTMKSISHFASVSEGMNELDITVPIAYRLMEETKN